LKKRLIFAPPTISRQSLPGNSGLSTSTRAKTIPIFYLAEQPILANTLRMKPYDELSIPEATALQKNLRAKLDIEERPLRLTLIGGADISLNLYSTTVYAGIILLSFPELRPVSWTLVKAETRFH